MIVSINFRDEKQDVVIDHDGGYEYDTNAHEIDWHFDMSNEEYDSLNITPEEEDDIYTQLCIKSYEGLWSCDDDVI